MSNTMTAYTYDSPPPSWYEPIDDFDDDDIDPAPAPPEALVIAHGWVWWTATDPDA